jgi:hypothetical protein
MMFDFSNFILNLQVNVRIMNQNDNFYLKDRKDSFEQKHHMKDRFIVVYFKIMLNYKSIID